MQIGYARVSTEDQNLDLQLQALKADGCTRILTDEGYSGALEDRPGLTEALSALQEGDTLVVWRLDRLSRSLTHLVQTLDALGKKRAEFRSLTEAIDTSTIGGRLNFHIISALAEFERQLISERTKAGMAAARKRGVRLGRKPKLDRYKLEHASELISSGRSRGEVAALLGVDSSTLYRHLRVKRSLS